MTLLISFLMSFVWNASALQMEVYGDSLSVGFMSQTSLTSPPGIDGIGKILTDLSMYKISGDEKYITPFKKPENTWSFMLAEKLKQKTPVTLLNKAHEGDRSFHIPAQVNSVAKTTEETIAFLLVGHNDVCSNNETADAVAKNYEQQVNESLRLWESKHENSKMYLIYVGDIPQVFETLANVVWAKSDQFTFDCKFSWKKIFPYCPYFAKLQQNSKMKEVLTPLLGRLNQTLEKLAKKWNEAQTSNRYIVLKTSNNVKYEVEDFGVDCFHLSKKGQSRLADLLAKDI